MKELVSKIAEQVGIRQRFAHDTFNFYPSELEEFANLLLEYWTNEHGNLLVCDSNRQSAINTPKRS